MYKRQAVVNADGTITESNKRTGTWAWKHYHKAEGTTDYRPVSYTHLIALTMIISESRQR